MNNADLAIDPGVMNNEDLAIEPGVMNNADLAIDPGVNPGPRERVRSPYDTSALIIQSISSKVLFVIEERRTNPHKKGKDPLSP